MEEIPDKPTRDVVESKLKEAKERIAKYEAYQKLMEETGSFDR